MALCVNQSGTYRNITTLCVNQSGTYRNVTYGSINQSGTYRNFLYFIPLGSSYEGGFLICKASPTRWVVSPYSAEVLRSWYCRDDAVPAAQSVSGCTGWFVPTSGQLQNPGFVCRSFWGPPPCRTATRYWSSDTGAHQAGQGLAIPCTDPHGAPRNKNTQYPVRAFRCVTY